MFSDSVQVRTCVNGTLYSLFQRTDFRNIGLNMGIDKKLENLMSSSNEYLNKQISYIIDILNSNKDNDNEEEYVEEVDTEDEQIDETYVSY